MNFLQLVQALHRESGSGGPLPTTVSGQTGEAARLVEWIRRADRAIQNLHTDWDFLWSQESITTAAGTSIYAYPAGVGIIDEDSFILGTNEPILGIDYLKVKGEGTDTQQGRPYRVVMLPNRTLRVDPVPNGVYTINFDYHAEPVTMALDNTATSIIPEPYREIIVAKALVQYGAYENAPDAIANGREMYNDWLQQLESRYLPGDRDAHKQAEGNTLRVEVE